MSSSEDSVEATLARITTHLRAAETMLGEADPVDPAAARQAALAEVRLASTAQRRYLRAVSHDLRNTLTSISGLAQMLERSLTKGTLTPERTHLALERIHESVARAAAIIDRLTEP